MNEENALTQVPTTYRQGDLLFKRIDDLPLENLTERVNGHILEGETTGHIHRIANRAKAALLETALGQMFIRVFKPADIVHEDHGTVTLPPGNYEVVRQREYTPEAVRQVVD